MAAHVTTFDFMMDQVRIARAPETRVQRRDLVDGTLLSHIAHGDQEAFRQAYDRASSVVYGMAFRMLLDPRDAEEATTDAFLHIWRKADTFDPELGNPTAWVIMIARCRILDRVRAQKARRQYEDSFDEGFEAPCSEPDAESLAIARHDADAVRTALARLGESQRYAIELAFFQGMTHQEIAEVTGRPLGTVKTQIRQGLLKLRRLLA